MNQTHTDPKGLAAGDLNPNNDSYWKPQGLWFSMSPNTLGHGYPKGHDSRKRVHPRFITSHQSFPTRSQRRLQTYLPSALNYMLSCTHSTCIHMTSPCSQALHRELEVHYLAGCQHTADPQQYPLLSGNITAWCFPLRNEHALSPSCGVSGIKQLFNEGPGTKHISFNVLLA